MTIIAEIVDRTGWTIETIRKLTWLQVSDIVFHPRGKNGKIAWGRDSAWYTEEEGFRDRWRAWGLRESIIDKKWAEFLAVESGYRGQLEAERLGAEEIERRVAAKWREVINNRKWDR